MTRSHVFVSYSHQDKPKLAQLLPYLRTLASGEFADVWSDVDLCGGARWAEELDAALDRATIAILLISEPFLASEFVRNHELPRILTRQLAGRLTVLPVYLSPSTVTSSSIPVRTSNGVERRIVLSAFQGFGTPDRTLMELVPVKRLRRFVALHERIRALSGVAPVANPTPRPDADEDDGEAQREDLTVERIITFDDALETIDEALFLYERRIPLDEQYDHDDMVGIVRRHLSDEYGPLWKMHLLVAKCGGRVVGLLMAYDDLQANLTFVSYLANDRRPPRTTTTARAGHASVETIGRRLAEDLLTACRELRPPNVPLRFLFEIDRPDAAATPTERRRRAGRLTLFEQFSRFAPFKGLRLRVIDVAYRQPPLGWPPPAHSHRPLFLCYAAPNLAATLPRAEVADLLDWVYLALYDSDLLECVEHRAPYKTHVRELLAGAKSGLPEPVPLLRSLQPTRSNG